MGNDKFSTPQNTKSFSNHGTFGAFAQVVETVDVGSNSGAEQEVSRFGGKNIRVQMVQTWHGFKDVSFSTSEQKTVGT